MYKNTFVDLLWQRSQKIPNKTAYIFLKNGEYEQGTLTYKELYDSAMHIGKWLSKNYPQQSRIVLVFEPGLEFIKAFWGCLLSNMIAVPAYPPDLNSHRKGFERLITILQDSQPSAILCSKLVKNIYHTILAQQKLSKWVTKLLSLKIFSTTNKENQPSSIVWKDINEIFSSSSLEEDITFPQPQNLAMLQYTSGSTSQPKGVMLSHENILANEEMIQEIFNHNENTIIVSWLPVYHDMGLIGNMLQPIYVGGISILMSPIAFLQKPLRWLQAISFYQATTSGGPNFGYDLCIRKIRTEELAKLDLSSWKIAFNGAEPIRCQTLDRFAEKFSQCGFSKYNFLPCYGLAEASLIVSGKYELCSTEEQKNKKEKINQNVYNSIVWQNKKIVSCGKPAPQTKIYIVQNPENNFRIEAKEILTENTVGEIWIQSPSVAQGYWNRKETTTETFARKIQGYEGYFLRTGDLGFWNNKELYIVGRCKDLIIQHGRNIYPQDLEEILEENHPELRPGCGAAFSFENEVEEIAIVYEIRPEIDKKGIEYLLENMHHTIAKECQIQVSTIILIPAHNIPKTTSGKIQRQATKEAFFQKKLTILASKTWPNIENIEETDSLITKEIFPQKVELEKSFEKIFSQYLGICIEEISLNKTLLDYGINSITSLQLQQELQEEWNISLELNELLNWNLLEIKEKILQKKNIQKENLIEKDDDETQTFKLNKNTEEKDDDETQIFKQEKNLTEDQKFVQTQTSFMATFNQRAMYVQEIEHQSHHKDTGLYNISSAFRIIGDLKISSFQKAWQYLIQNCDVLRSYFILEKERLWQKIAPFVANTDILKIIAISGNISECLPKYAFKAFDLSKPPLLRLILIPTKENCYIFLFVIHHLISDYRSLEIIFEQFWNIYNSYNKSKEPQKIAKLNNFFEYATLQNDYIKKLENNSISYSKFAHPEILDFSIFGNRFERNDRKGWQQQLTLSEETSKLLLQFCQQKHITVASVMLASLMILLAQQIQQKRIGIGCATIGRTKAKFQNTIGYCMSPQIITEDIDLNESPNDFAYRLHQKILEILKQQDCPLAWQIEKNPIQRKPGYPPLFQVMFIFQQSFLEDNNCGQYFQSLALNSGEINFEISGLQLSAIPFFQTITPFDITLTVSQINKKIVSNWIWASNIFSSTYSLSERWKYLLETWLKQYHQYQKIYELPKMTSGEFSCQLSRSLVNYEKSPHTWIYVNDIILYRCRQFEQKIAIQFNHIAITYRQVATFMIEIAEFLKKENIGTGNIVGIYLDRGWEMLVIMLGIMQANAAYLPLDPNFPSNRLEYMIKDAKVSLIFTSEKFEKHPCIESSRNNQIKISYVDHLNEQRKNMVNLNKNNILGSTAAKAYSFDCASNLAYVLYTSGSTGNPKGVEISHQALSNSLCGLQKRLGISSKDIFLAITTLSFDIAELELLLPLMFGAQVIISDYDTTRNPAKLVELMNNSHASIMQATPTTWRMLVQSNYHWNRKIKILCGGEIMSYPLAKDLLQRGDSSVYNLYGPTETTIWSSMQNLENLYLGLKEEFAKNINVGYAIANTEIYILDSELRLQIPGQIGEIAIGGYSLANGYHNNPEETAKKFIPNPFYQSLQQLKQHALKNSKNFKVGSKRLYLTGDYGRILPSGYLEITGRKDQQIKIHGFRVELSEIENCLLKHPEIIEACVVVPTHIYQQDIYLVAYLKYSKNCTLTIDQTRAFLMQYLPQYMIPSYFVALIDLPKTPNNKIDRNALSELPLEEHQFPNNVLEPYHNATEELLSNIWEKVLNQKNISRTADFFSLGGNSLNAMKVAAQIHKTFGIEINLGEILQPTKLKDFAISLQKKLENRYEFSESFCIERIECENSLEQYETNTNKNEMSDSYLSETTLSVSKQDNYIHKKNKKISLSWGQYQLWFLYQTDIAMAYHISGGFEFDGNLDLIRLENAWKQIIQKHSTLRSIFPSYQGEPFCQILSISEFSHYIRPSIDISSLSLIEQEKHLSKISKNIQQTAFDLTNGPLVRWQIVKISEKKHFLFITLHHLICDGWSLDIIMEEICQLYKKNSSDIQIKTSVSIATTTSFGYFDFVKWQNYLCEKQAGKEALTYWKNILSGELPILSLPYDYLPKNKNVLARSISQITFGKREKISLTPNLTSQLKKLSQSQNVTLFMLLLAGWAAVLQKYCGQEDILLATPFANRYHQELQNTIGYFVNTLVLRFNIQTLQNFYELLKQTSEMMKKTYRYGKIPWEWIHQKLDRSHQPNIQVFVNWVNFDEQKFQLPDITTKVLPAAEVIPKFDLNLYIYPYQDHLDLEIIYPPNLFMDTTIQRMLNQYKNFLELATHSPSTPIGNISLLSKQECLQIIANFNENLHHPLKFGTKTEYNLIGETVHDWLENSFCQHSNHVALDWKNQQISYSQLANIRNTIAWKLIDENCSNNSYILKNPRIAILLPNKISFVASMLAIIQTGNIFAPLNPEFPEIRLAKILEKLQPSLLLTDSSLENLAKKIIPASCKIVWINTSEIEQFLEIHSPNLPLNLPHPEPCYLYFTSGSTGNPKGILGKISGLSHFLRWEIETLPFHTDIRVSQITLAHVDVMLRDVLAPLCVGGTICIPDEPNDILDIPKLCKWLTDKKIEVLHCVPSLFSAIIATKPQLPQLSSLRYVLMAGEIINVEDMAYCFQHYERQIQVYNLYGATETNLVKFFHAVQTKDLQRGFIPSGKPMTAVRAIVINEANHICAPGEMGEMYIRTPYLSLGYFDDVELTSQTFILNPFTITPDSKDIIYKTGDIVRLLGDNSYKFLGRKDHQIKIHGLRMETTEIEQIIATFPNIQQVIVILPQKETNLVAFIIAEKPIDTKSLVESLKQQLPMYMIPRHFISVKSFPRLLGGKLDRHQLQQIYQEYCNQQKDAIQEIYNIQNNKKKSSHSSSNSIIDAADNNESNISKNVDLKNENKLLTKLDAANMPSNDIESCLCLIWQEILQCPVGIHDNFFELGGHSLLITRVLALVNEILGIQIPIRLFFNSPTIHGLENAILNTQEFASQRTQILKLATLFVQASEAAEKK